MFEICPEYADTLKTYMQNIKMKKISKFKKVKQHHIQFVKNLNDFSTGAAFQISSHIRCKTEECDLVFRTVFL